MERARILQMLMTCRQQAEQLRRLSGLAERRESGEICMSANALFQAAVIIESLISANEKALEGIARLDRSENPAYRRARSGHRRTGQHV